MATLMRSMRRGSGAGTERVEGRAGWRGVLALVCAVLLASCQDRGPATGTALYVTTQFDPTLLLNPGKVFPLLHRCAELGRMHVHDGVLPFPDLPRL